MPIYQYQCAECGHQMEAIQKMSDPRLTDCPQCEEPALKKQVTAAAFKLKGTGWYETDFKNPKKGVTKSGTGTDSSEPSNSSRSGDSDSGQSTSGESANSTESTESTKGAASTASGSDN